jgi:hypothetical protein
VWLVGLSAGEQMDSYRAIDGDHRGACCPVAWWGCRAGVTGWVSAICVTSGGAATVGSADGVAAPVAGGARLIAIQVNAMRSRVRGMSPPPAGRGHVDGEAAER